MSILAADAIVPTRNLNLLYIILDSVFLVVYLALLLWKKRYSTVIFAPFFPVSSISSQILSTL